MTRRENIVRHLRGVFVPLASPMDGRSRIRYRSFRENLGKLTRLPLGGFVVAGSTGEAPYLREEERLRLLEVARPVVQAPQLLIAGTGLESTQQTIRLSKAAQRHGADAVLVLTPHYYRAKMNSAAFEAHFARVAESLEIPVILYSVPQFTGIRMEAKTIARLSQHSNIAGLKESSADLAYLSQILRQVNPSFRVFVGTALYFLQALRRGAAGGVLGVAGYVPELCLSIYHAFQRKDWDKARAYQRHLRQIAQQIAIPHGVAGVKAAMEVRGLAGGSVRCPLFPLGESDRRAIHRALNPLGFLG